MDPNDARDARAAARAQQQVGEAAPVGQEVPPVVGAAAPAGTERRRDAASDDGSVQNDSYFNHDDDDDEGDEPYGDEYPWNHIQEDAFGILGSSALDVLDKLPAGLSAAPTLNYADAAYSTGIGRVRAVIPTGATVAPLEGFTKGALQASDI